MSICPVRFDAASVRNRIGVYSLWSRAESLFLDASETPQSWSRMSAISSSSRVAARTQQLYVKISHTHTQIWGRGLICHFVGGANKEVIGVNIAHCHFSCRLSAWNIFYRYYCLNQCILVKWSGAGSCFFFEIPEPWNRTWEKSNCGRRLVLEKSQTRWSHGHKNSQIG